MARKDEQRLWDTMKANAPFDIKMERMENGVGAGGPDVHTIRRGKTVWFELKALEVPAFEKTPIIKNDTFEKDQPKWHKVYHHHGGVSFCLARDDWMNLYLIPGYDIAYILQEERAVKRAGLRLQDLTYVQLKAMYGVKDWPTLFARAYA